MQYRTFQRFAGLVYKLEAREKLDLAPVIAFPHLEKDARERLRKAWLEEAGLQRNIDLKSIPYEKINAFLRGDYTPGDDE
jgi:hypothetical protein